jgi:hypothetical protein
MSDEAVPAAVVSEAAVSAGVAGAAAVSPTLVELAIRARITASAALISSLSV